MPKRMVIIRPEFKTERTQFVLGASTKESFKKAVAEDGLSMNEVVNELIELWLIQRGARKNG